MVTVEKTHFINTSLRSSQATYIGLGAEGMVDSGWLGKDFDTIVVDPPRKGCNIKVVDAINEGRAKMLVYVR